MTRADPPAVDVCEHLEWAEVIGRRVARRWRFRPGGQEERDVVQVAVFAMLRAARRYRPEFLPPGGCPAGLFRGFAARDVVSEASRESRRLLNAGCYHTRRERAASILVGYSFSDLSLSSATGEFDLPDEARPDAEFWPGVVGPPANPRFDVTPDPADARPSGGRAVHYPERPRGRRQPEVARD